MEESWEDQVHVLATSKNAILVDYEGVETWIPRSLLQLGTEVEEKGDVGLLVIPLWKAQQESFA